MREKVRHTRVIKLRHGGAVTEWAAYVAEDRRFERGTRCRKAKKKQG